MVTYSTAKSFDRLKKMEIWFCKRMIEMVKSEQDEERDAISFKNLKSLSLMHLESLTSFCSGYCSFKFPSLGELIVGYCPKIKIFTRGYLSAPKLYSVKHEDKKRWDGDLNTTIRGLYHRRIDPNLEELRLSGEDFMIIWQQGQFLENLFCSLKVLEIKDDESTNIPPDIVKRFNNLKNLKLFGCEYTEIFLCGGEEKQLGTPIEIKELKFPQNLENLDVRKCDNLITLMPTSASFQNLTVVMVSDCDGLINMVTFPAIKSLKQLREMHVWGCKLMVEMVKTEKDNESDAISFNTLKLLVLKDLESLTCFCSGNYTFKFPSLEELIVENCPEMKTFTRGVLGTPMLQKVKLKKGSDEECWDDDLNTTIQQLHRKKVNSSLENLTVSGKEILMMQQGQFPAQHHFDRVKILEVIKDESTSIPPLGTLQRFNNLVKLILKASSYEEIFSWGEGEEHSVMLTQMKDLELWSLFNLKCIWKGESQLYSILQNLENLGVHYCHSFISLAPSSASFENLTTLEVHYCNGLVNLITSSVAKSLVRLKKMDIQRCEMMQGIVANDKDLLEDDIVFNELEELVLCHLKSLASFCSGNHTFRFPTLEILIVKNCPNMKTFSHGVIYMPRLQKVNRLDDDEGFWRSDINTTIQHLHETVGYKKKNDCDFRRRI